VNRSEGLRAGLERARALGFLGPGAVEDHVQHAEGFAVATRRRLGHDPASLLDLGSGGGVPGLVLAGRWPETGVALVESGHRRCEHLRMEVEGLGWAGRVEVIEERAERVAHSPELRERWELVTARSFASPAATAEIAAGLVAPGGLLLVSEPPEEDPARWPADQLRSLGFGAPFYEAAGHAHFACFVKTHDAPTDVPRGVGRPGKRPRW
jgi:16S rRNA (guanine527-N7)-methyltransferase